MVASVTRRSIMERATRSRAIRISSRIYYAAFDIKQKRTAAAVLGYIQINHLRLFRIWLSLMRMSRLARLQPCEFPMDRTMT
jgi:hypothetical protein